MRSSTFYPEIEGLRGILSLVVLFHHLFGAVLPESEHPFMWGWGSMDMFFCISGFLIGRNFFTRYAGRPSSAYFVNRMLRIWPMYYAAFAFCAGTTALFANALMFGQFKPLSSAQGIGEVLPLLFMQNVERHWGVEFTYLQIFKHSWSVALEEQFYLIAPFALLIMRARSTAFIAAVIALSLLGIIYLRAAGMNHAALLARSDGFLLGLLLAVCYVRAAQGDRLASVLHSRMTCIAAVAYSFVGIACYIAKFHGVASVFVAPFGFLQTTLFNPYTAFALFTYGLLGLVARGSLPSPFSKALGIGPLQWLGRISYSTYLMHNAIVFVLAPAIVSAMGLSLMWVLPVGAVLTIVTAHLTFNAIEKPFMRRKIKGEVTSTVWAKHGSADGGVERVA